MSDDAVVDDAMLAMANGAMDGINFFLTCNINDMKEEMFI